MQCFKPLTAYQRENGEIVFAERGAIVRVLSLRCGQCIGCRLKRSRDWALRVVHEKSLHRESSFVTLTYDDAHLPDRGQLVYRDYQLWFKRLRKALNGKPVRFYMCGEYGDEGERPHFHACVFGEQFGDRVRCGTGGNGDPIYRSELLDKTWGKGFASVGELTFESAAYVARYCLQKVNGHNAKYHYARRDERGEYQLQPEFNKMSLKPGIASEWFERYSSDVYPHDYVVSGDGKKLPAPRYYDRLMKRLDADVFEEIQMQRELDALSRSDDNTPRRMADKEAVAIAREAFKKRNSL